jgi:hypothetical protein
MFVNEQLITESGAVRSAERFCRGTCDIASIRIR